MTYLIRILMQFIPTGRRRLPHCLYLLLMASYSVAGNPVSATLPEAVSGNFCRQVQKRLAGTTLASRNTVHEDLETFRKSRPVAEPLQIFQHTTIVRGLPLVVSCKVKSADNLQAVYGAQAAGPQAFCSGITRQLVAQAEQQLLTAGEAEAAAKLRQFVIDDDEPYMTGSSYLSDYAPIYRHADGRLHIASPGLHINWESWWRYIMPDQLLGQSYCHLVTVNYLKAVARGDLASDITVSFDLPP